MAETPEVITIRASAAAPLTIDVVPALGGSLLAARWRGALITRPLTLALDQMTVSNTTSFAMAPFANRIDSGRFETNGREVIMPINRPAQNVAIHGIARNRSWRIESRAPDRLEVAVDVDASDYPFKFSARQVYSVSADAWTTALEVRNNGSQAMPFGIGHHPFFRRTPRATLQFSARGYFDTDAARNLPTAPSGPADGPMANIHLTAADSIGIDRHYYGWSGPARIEWPEDALALEVSASSTLANAHVYLSPDEESLCIEPVSHVPDVHNHADWRAFGDVTILEPGQTMTGTMTCRVIKLAPD